MFDVLNCFEFYSKHTVTSEIIWIDLQPSPIQGTKSTLIMQLPLDSYLPFKQFSISLYFYENLVLTLH